VGCSQYIANRLIVETVYNAIFWLNYFPHKNGIHPTLSPCTIITGSTIDYNKHCALQFGSSVQVHEPHNNSLMPRTTGAIALWPSGNAQGGYYFMSLTSQKQLIRNKWTVLPMPAKVIATIHQLAAACKRCIGIVFTDKDGNIIDGVNKNKDTGVKGNNTPEITGVDMTEADITGVGTGVGNNNNAKVDNTGVDNTGVGNHNNLDAGNEQTSNNQHEDNEQYDKQYLDAGNEQTSINQHKIMSNTTNNTMMTYL